MEKKAFSAVIHKIWDNPNYKEEFIKNPRVFLKKEGIEIPENVKLIVHENTDNEIHLIIPQKPTVEFADNELEAMAGGTAITRDDVKKLYDRLYGKK
jgi:Nitrile hydratase, alpha chain